MASSEFAIFYEEKKTFWIEKLSKYKHLENGKIDCYPNNNN